MANINLIQSGKVQPPTIICPYCKKEMLIDVSPFNKNIANLVKDKCPRCRGEVYFTVLLLANSSIDALIKSIQLVVQSLNAEPKNRIINVSGKN